MRWEYAQPNAVIMQERNQPSPRQLVSCGEQLVVLVTSEWFETVYGQMGWPADDPSNFPLRREKKPYPIITNRL